MTDDQKAVVCGLMLLSFSFGWILGYIIAAEAYERHALETQEGYYDPQTGAFKYNIMDEDSSM